MNNWGIPDWLENTSCERDKCCVFAALSLLINTNQEKLKPGEHIINDARIINKENIARCGGLQFDKGTKNFLNGSTQNIVK
jgi:hypothetical protein